MRDGDLQKGRAMVKAGAKLNIQDQCGAIPFHEAGYTHLVSGRALEGNRLLTSSRAIIAAGCIV